MQAAPRPTAVPDIDDAGWEGLIGGGVPADFGGSREDHEQLYGGPGRPTPSKNGGVAVAVDACPVHHKPWKTVPAGTSKAGKAYAAFKACPEFGCKERPR